MRATLQSLLIHLGTLGLLLLLLFAFGPHEEIPVELVEVQGIRSSPGTPASKARQTAVKTPIKPSLKTTTSTSSDPAQSSATGATTGGSGALITGAGESFEDYEVSELPVLLNEVRIPYPPEARSRGIQGPVLFELVLSSNGEVSSAKVLDSPAPELTDAAIFAVRKFRFRPARINDKPVAIRIRYTYRFILE